LELKKKQEEEEAQKEVQRRRRNRMLTAVTTMAVLLMTCLGGWRYQTWKASLEYDPQEYYQLPLEDLSISSNSDPGAINPADFGKNPGDTVPTNPSNAGGNNGSHTPSVNDVHINNNNVASVRPNSVASSTPGVRPSSNAGGTPGPDAVPELPSFGATPTVDISAVGGHVGGSGDVLSDRGEIEAMAARVIKVYNSQILACYSQAVKQIPDLKGIWTVSFTITPGGTTDNIRVKAAGTANPDMEACMLRQVGTWKFEKLAQEFKLAKQYRLSPSGW